MKNEDVPVFKLIQHKLGIKTFLRLLAHTKISVLTGDGKPRCTGPMSLPCRWTISVDTLSSLKTRLRAFWWENNEINKAAIVQFSSA